MHTWWPYIWHWYTPAVTRAFWHLSFTMYILNSLEMSFYSLPHPCTRAGLCYPHFCWLGGTSLTGSWWPPCLLVFVDPSLHWDHLAPPGFLGGVYFKTTHGYSLPESHSHDLRHHRYILPKLWHYTPFLKQFSWLSCPHPDASHSFFFKCEIGSSPCVPKFQGKKSCLSYRIRIKGRKEDFTSTSLRKQVSHENKSRSSHILFHQSLCLILTLRWVIK